MGNLVTNGLVLSGPVKSLIGAVARMTPMDAGPLVEEAKQDSPVWARFWPSLLVPEPTIISATIGATNVDIGLAALSVGDKNFLRIKQNADPLMADLPAEYQETVDSTLRKLEVDGLTGDALLDAVEAKTPGAIDAGRVAIAAYEETGTFGWYDWRLKHWGCRAFGEDLRISMQGDDLELRFDSVNSAPIPLITALAKAFPDIEIVGASFDEDNDYAVLFESDPNNSDMIDVVHQDDEEGVRSARVRLGLPEISEDEEYTP